MKNASIRVISAVNVMDGLLLGLKSLRWYIEEETTIEMMRLESCRKWRVSGRIWQSLDIPRPVKAELGERLTSIRKSVRVGTTKKSYVQSVFYKEFTVRTARSIPEWFSSRGISARNINVFQDHAPALPISVRSKPFLGEIRTT